MLRVLTSYKNTEIGAAASSLSIKEIDVLMKYIYRGFAEPKDSYCASLLTWHDRVCRVFASFVYPNNTLS